MTESSQHRTGALLNTRMASFLRPFMSSMGKKHYGIASALFSLYPSCFSFSLTMWNAVVNFVVKSTLEEMTPCPISTAA